MSHGTAPLLLAASLIALAPVVPASRGAPADAPAAPAAPTAPTAPAAPGSAAAPAANAASSSPAPAPDQKKLEQHLIFPEIPAHFASEDPFVPAVRASSGLPVTLSIVSGPAQMIEGKIRLFGLDGTVIVRADQDGNGRYLPALPQERVMSVRPVPSAPSFSPLSSADHTVEIGGTVILESDVRGDPPPKLQWRHNGNPIRGADGFTLTVGPVTLDDAGDYDVVATNPKGATVGSRSRITVARRSQTIQMSQLPLMVSPGQTLQLSAFASSGLRVTFECVSGPGNMIGDSLNVTGPGMITLRVSQEGNSTYAPATPVVANLTSGR